MSTKPTDARLRELQFLSEVERRGSRDFNETHTLDQREKGMIMHLIYEGYLNGVGLQTTRHRDDWEAGQRELARSIEYERWSSLISLTSGQQLSLRVSHKGLVRLSELQHALQTGREREPFNIMLSQRYRDRDLTIALFSAREESPVTVAYLDMNNLKLINDQYGGHAAGDAAIKTYLQTIAVICGGDIDGYRGDGGDEVVLIMKGKSPEQARELLGGVLRKLQGEKVNALPIALTASCGIAATTEPATDAQVLLSRADQAQYRAKAEAKTRDPRPSVIVVEDLAPEVVVVEARP